MKKDARTHGGTKERSHPDIRAHKHQPPTFFERLANFNVAVCSLELVEERADFEFVRDALPKLRHNSAVLSGGPHLKHSPLALLLALW